ncbi:MAG: hypothetical protein WC947_07685 [Elusimicrobiota bacterium]
MVIDSEYEDMLEKGEQIMRVYESRRFIILLENLPVIILAVGCLYFFFHILLWKLTIFFQLSDYGIFFNRVRFPLYMLSGLSFVAPFIIGLLLYLYNPIGRKYKYILTDKKFILDFPDFPKPNIIYYDKIRKVELINKKIEGKFNLSTIKLFLKSSKAKNKFVVIPAVKNPNEFVANLEKMINGGY